MLLDQIILDESVLDEMLLSPCVIMNSSAKQCDWLTHARPAPFPFTEINTKVQGYPQSMRLL